MLQMLLQTFMIKVGLKKVDFLKYLNRLSKRLLGLTEEKKIFSLALYFFSERLDMMHKI
jgi:hypothetical protein